MNRTRWQVIETKDAFSKRLTAAQRDFAFEVIYNRLANAADPTQYADHDGAVKPLGYNLHHQYSFKPAAHLRHYHDLEIRVRFRVLRGCAQLFIERVAPRDEVYGRKS